MMAKMNFTKDQLKAIETTDSNLLVSAAAGSGKTAVLVQRIVRMITDKQKPVDIDRLLVVTFTEAAALEMRQRISQAIDDMIKNAPQNEHLKRQEMLMGRASITTMHSFCLGVIRKYFYLTNIDPNFRIIDTTESELLKTETMRIFFEQLYENDNIELFEEVLDKETNEDFLKLVESYGDKVKDDKLQSMALSLYDFIQSSPWPEKWLLEQSEKLDVDSAEDIEKSQWYKYFVSETRTLLDGALNSVDIAIGLCDHYEINPIAIDALIDDKEKINTVIDSLDKGLENFWQSMQFKFSTMRLALPKKKGEEDSEEAVALKKQIADIRKDEIKGPIADIQKKALFVNVEEIVSNINKSSLNIKTLCNIVIGFSKRFYELKRNKNIADFSDFEHLCIETLLDKNSTPDNIIPSVAAIELRERYAEILTDEYQDSNLVQELILSIISEDDKNHRFMVGDIKQSIYKFRMANPDLFKEKYIAYDVNGNDNGTRIDLSKNFRSRKSVLAGINFIFKQIMSEGLGEVSYDENAALYYGANYPEPADEETDKIELMLLDMGEEAGENYLPNSQDESNEKDEELAESSLDILAELSSSEIEAKMIAGRIKELLGDNTNPPFQVTDKNNSFRDIEPKDIVIILRSVKNTSESYVRELKNANIPAFSDASSGYFEAIEIMTVLSMLRVIDNPRQDVHLISILYSSIFNFTADELIEIRMCLKKGMFIDCMDEYALNNNETPRNIIIVEKINKFKSDLEKWREMAIYNSISDLLQLLYEDTGYFDYVSAMQGGRVRQANLTALFERAILYEQTRLKGLFHFIKYIEKMQKNNAEFATAKVASENDNLVRVMSAHKSKGLEFPVVFVCGLGRRFNLRDASSELLVHQNLGFGPMNIDLEQRVKYNTLTRYAISRKIIMESLSEEMRVLYVALTRAKEKLFLSGTCKDIQKSIEKANQYLSENDFGISPYRLAQKRSFLDWIIYSVLRHKDVIDSLGLKNEMKYFEPLYNDSSSWKINIVKKSELQESVEKKIFSKMDVIKQLEKIDVDKDYSGKKSDIEKCFSYEYPYLKLTKVPSKISISEIKRINYESQEPDSEPFEKIFKSSDNLSLKQPDFMMDKAANENTATRRGTLMHSVMQRLELDKHTGLAGVDLLVTEMLDKKMIDASDEKLIDTQKIAMFTETTLAKRMKESHFIRKELPFVLGVEPYKINPQWKDIGEENILVHGIIDCIFEEDGEIVLLDYKSDRVNEKTLDNVIERYKIQMSIYKKAVEAGLGKKVKETLIYFFELNNWYVIIDKDHF